MQETVENEEADKDIMSELKDTPWQCQEEKLQRGEEERDKVI